MNCLCCGKPLQGEVEKGWHKRCIRNFFGTHQLPPIELNDSILEMLAQEMIGQGLTVPGVQKKLSLHLLSEEDTPRLTLVNYPSGYILKPQVEEYQALPEAEHLIMSMADAVGISVVPHALLQSEVGMAYITRRVDRVQNNKQIQILAMEDFCQLDYRLTEDKYRGSYERCAKIIRKYSSRVGIDLAEFYLRILFSFVIGNSDMHLKNFSLLETYEGSMQYVLSPAYDLLPVNVIVPADKEQVALAMNGKKRNLQKNDFLKLADACGLDRKIAMRLIHKVISQENRFLTMCETSLIRDAQKEQLAVLIRERIAVLE